VFVPAGHGGNFMKQYAERGLDKAGIKVIGPGGRDGRRSLEQYGRWPRLGNRHCTSVFGGSSVGDEQGIRCGPTRRPSNSRPRFHGGEAAMTAFT